MSHEPGDAAVRMLGLVLRHFRNRAGHSLRELGKLALYDYSRLSRAENGEVLIPVEQVRVLDKLLDADGLLLALRQAAEPERYAPALGLDVVSFGESAVADEGDGDADEREEVVGFAFVAAVESAVPVQP